MTTASQIAAIIAEDEYEVYGIRAHRGEAASVGATVAKSFVWVDGECTDEEMAGTSALRVKVGDDIGAIIAKVRAVYGWDNEEIILVAGQSYMWGEDSGEVVIEDCRVLAIA